MKVKVKVAQSCPTLCDPMDCSLPSYSVRGVFQARILEWVSLFFAKVYLPDPGMEPESPAAPAGAGGFFTTGPLGKSYFFL